MAFMKHLAELYKTTGNNSFDFIEYMSVPNHSAALEELMAKGYVSWKDDFQNILGTITINLDRLHFSMARFSFPHKLSLAIFDRLSSADIAYAGVPGFPVGQFISSHPPLVKSFHEICVK